MMCARCGGCLHQRDELCIAKFFLLASRHPGIHCLKKDFVFGFASCVSRFFSCNSGIFLEDHEIGLCDVALSLGSLLSFISSLLTGKWASNLTRLAPCTQPPAGGLSIGLPLALLIDPLSFVSYLAVDPWKL